MSSGESGESQRVDKFLWFSRLTKTRGEAQALAESRRLRIDGRVVSRPSALVRPGSVLAFTRFGKVRIVRVDILPTRRSSATDSQLLYSDLTQD